MKNNDKTGRRKFLGMTGKAIVGASVVAAGSTLLGKGSKEARAQEIANSTPSSFPTPDYDWTEHRWAYGIDVTRCIGCLRCVEACKAENDVAGDPSRFRTWVERYVYLEGDDEVHVDSHAHFT